MPRAFWCVFVFVVGGEFFGHKTSVTKKTRSLYSYQRSIPFSWEEGRGHKKTN